MRTPEQDTKNQNKCPRCNRIVGCDAQGKTRECDCQRPQTMREYIAGMHKACIR